MNDVNNGLKFKNKKTRMCNNLFSSSGCVYGSDCHYAHSRDELVVTDCAYGCDCIYIKAGDVNNNFEKICYFIHPTETLDSYYERITTTNLDPVVYEPPVSIDLSNSIVSCKEEEVCKIISDNDTTNWNIKVTNAFLLMHKLLERGDTEINFKITY